MKSAAALFLLFGGLLLAALFWWFRPEQAVVPAALAALEALPVAPAPAEHPPEPPVSQMLLRIEDGRLSGGAQVLRTRLGTRVWIELFSDRAGELHLHGYDHELTVRPGEPARMEFLADRSGRFELELHAHPGHIELGALEVLPP